MASEGPLSPATGTSEARTGGDAHWSNPGNISAADASVANVVLTGAGDTSHWLVATDFGFSIPATDQIVGIVAEFRMRVAAPSADLDSATLWLGGAATGTEKTANSPLGGSFGYISRGGATDDWDATLTGSDVNSTGFGVALSAVRFSGTPDIECDHVRVTVHHSPAGVELAGSIDIVTAWAGDLQVVQTHELAGSIDIATDWAGTLSVLEIQDLAGSIDIVTDWSGDLQVQGNVPLAGEIDIATDWSGDLSVTREVDLAGDIAIQTSWTGKLIVGSSPITTSLDQEPVYQFRARRFSTLATVGLITDFQSLRYERRLHSLGEFQASILMAPELLDWVNNEGVLEVIRNGETVFVGICDNFNSDDDYDPGTNEGTVRGIDARAVLGWRQVFPPDGSEADEQDGVAAQNAIRHYVENNLTDPTDTSRDIDGELTGVSFLIEAGALGSNVSRSERYSNLLDVAFAIAQAGDIWFEVTLTAGEDYQLAFSAFNDKTAGETDQVLFATRQGTALSLPYNVSRRGYTNAVTVIGERTDTHQTRITVEDLGNGSSNRRESVITGGGVRTSAILTIDDVTQFWTDWSDELTTVGPGPAFNETPVNWTPQWDTSNIDAFIEKTAPPSGTTGGAALSLDDRSNGAGNGRFMLSSDFIGFHEGREVEIACRMRTQDTQSGAMYVVAHGSNIPGTGVRAYLFEANDPANPDWWAYVFAGGTGIPIQLNAPTYAADTWYVLRQGLTSESFRVQVWQGDGGDDPGGWADEVDNRQLEQGWLGPGCLIAAEIGQSTWCDWIGIGLDGAAAPTSMPAQTVTIGSTTYTFTWDMTTANNILPSLDGEVMVERLAAAINGDAGEGTIYGTGTTAHGDVVAVANGHNLRILATGATTADIDLSTALHNGSWDFSVIRLAPLVELANGVLTEGAERIRSYEVAPNPATVPFRTAVDIGDIVTVRNGALNVEDDKLIRAVKVQFSQTGGERFTLELGELPLTLIDIIQQNRQDTDRIGRR